MVERFGSVVHMTETADAFIQKPITPDTLSRKVREVLDEKK